MRTRVTPLVTPSLSFCHPTSGHPTWLVVRVDRGPTATMSSIICAVWGCHNNWIKRRRQLEQQCFDHKVKRSECCGAFYNLHPPPKDAEHLRQWQKALNLKRPPKRPYVCSYHFVDGKPSEEHPYPEKWLGYDAPLNNTPGLLKTLRSRGRTLKGQSAYERAGGGERLGVDARAGSREDVTSAEDGEAAHPCPDHDYASPHPPAQVVSPIKEESSQWHEGSSLIDGKVDVKPVIIKTEENEQEIAEQQPVVQVPKLEPCVKKEEEEKHKVCAFPEAAPHRCADCGEAFSGSASLQLHQSVHVGGTQDGKSFNKLSQPSLLQGAFTGSKKRTLSCDQSREAFAASWSLKAVSWLQASKKTEICGVCGRIFNDTRAFQEHMGSHLGEQLHRCPECQKAFASVWDMMAHWRVHRGREAQQGGDSSESFRQRDQQGERAAELPCSCGRHVQQYSQLEPLQSFRKGEKPYHCEKCDKTFVRKSSLNRHQKVHQGLPRCAQCHLSFRNPSQLARHQQIHTAGHDALSCSLCKTGDQHHHYVRVPPRCREATLIPRVSGSLTGPS